MPTKIAVLGGGCGSMTAVWALTQIPNWQQKFDITVYQIGWRLGGKCASGRDEANAFRIYEHGLHVWGGFYQNAFRLMEEVYAALPRDAGNPIAPPRPPGDPPPAWKNAFQRMSTVIFQENVNGNLINWELDIPEDKSSFPGTDGTIPTPWQYIKLIVDELRKRFSPRVPTPAEEPLLDRLSTVLQSESVTAGGSIFPRLFPNHYETPADLTYRRPLDDFNVLDILDSAKKFADSFPEDSAEHLSISLDDVLYFLEEAARIFLKLYTIAGSDYRRRAEFILNFVMATCRGIMNNGVIGGGWEVINDREWRDWLASNGAKSETLDSALVRGIYDYVFGFVKGQPDNPQLEAGTATHGVLRLFFTYKGAIFWEMLAGMGDVVFAPIYRVLSDRGVKFEFFSKVMNLRVQNNKVETIEMVRQATTKNGPYQPLITVGGIPAWPAHPRYDQLNEGDELRNNKIDLESHWTSWNKGKQYTLQRGPDFGIVILGISIAALRDIAAEVAKENEKFANMLDHVQTVQTHSMQLWLDADSKRLGAPQVRRCGTAATEPIATWCDMSYLLDREKWPANGPKYLAYFCGQLDDVAHQGNDYPQFMLQHFKQIALDWLRNYTKSIWPNAVLRGTKGLDWSLLHDDSGAAGEARLDAQYLRVNVNPSDRYVASFPGTSQWRLPADRPVLANLFIAGDWVKTPINAGCVEAAVMAGLYAAQGVSGEQIPIIGG
jgi:uncharacterized protein with NAD-binding domain and iron-sulfur cluster